MHQKHYTLPEKLTEIAKRFPDRIALQIRSADGYQTYTYLDLYNNAKSIAEALIEHGIQKGDRVAIILENRPEWSFIYFGILFAGGIAVPLDPQSQPEEFKYFFENSESKILFSSPKFKKIVLDPAKNVATLQEIIFLDEKSFTDFLNNPNKLSAEIKTNHEDIASLLYTSGTTSKPKGVMLTHENFYSNFRGVEKLKLFAKKQNILSILPLHHSFPFMTTLLIPLFTRSKVTYITSLKRDEMIKAMQETGVTILIGVPELFYFFHQAILSEIKKIPFFVRLPLLGMINIFYQARRLTKINLNKLLLRKIHKTFGKSLKYFACGGAKLDNNIETFLNKLGFSLIQGYGLTETSPIVTFNPTEKTKIGSVGKAITGVNIKIMEPDENGIGEVLIRGPNVMKGYYQNEEETKKTIKDGWLYSGDLGHLDKDGYLFLTGRKKELIILGSGKNISPQEVETHYAKSHYLKELCVLPVGEGEEEKLVAVILPDFEYFKKTGEIDINDIVKQELNLLSRDYPEYKRIMGFVITKEDFPKTNLGKLKRHKIREKHLEELMGIKPEKHKEELSTEDLEIAASITYKTVAAVITKEKELSKPPHLNDHLGMDLDFDSLSRIELLSNLEKELNVSVPEQLIGKISTVKELVLTIDKLAVEQKLEISPTKETPKETLWQNILTTDPTAKITNKIDLSPNWLAKTFGLLFYGGLYVTAKILWRIKISGTENLPKNKPFILCPNHTSYLDGFLVGASVPSRLKQTIFFLGYHIYFNVPIIRKLIKIGKIIPIDPASNLIDAMQACGYVLRNGKTICIFPEGARSPDGSVQNFRKGVGILAYELNIPLVPVYIDGSFEALPRGKAFPKFNQIKITFGKPLSPDQLKEKGQKLGIEDSYEAITRGIQKEVHNPDVS